MPRLDELPDSKWSAVQPRNREKHFVVTRVIRSDPEAPRVELQAVLTKRRIEVPLERLLDPKGWKRGWS